MYSLPPPLPPDPSSPPPLLILPFPLILFLSPLMHLPPPPRFLLPFLLLLFFVFLPLAVSNICQVTFFICPVAISRQMEAAASDTATLCQHICNAH